jgi:hypothetical protein
MRGAARSTEEGFHRRGSLPLLPLVRVHAPVRHRTAGALRRVSEHPLGARFTTTEPLLRPPNFHFNFVTAEDGLHVRADDGRFVTEVPIGWAFGGGAHAVTFVSQVSADFYLEHSFSYYPAAGTFALTPVTTPCPLRRSIKQWGSRSGRKAHARA